MSDNQIISRRHFLAGTVAGMVGAQSFAAEKKGRALIAITLDLEMSAHYPRRGMLEWNYRKGALDDATKKYAVDAGKIVKDAGGVLHFFSVGQTLEQPNIDWLTQLAEDGHPIGNHTYDHVNVKAKTSEAIQFRFRRAPWLLRDRNVKDVIAENIRLTTAALKERAKVKVNGFRTPGGFHDGLSDRVDVQKMLLDQGFTWVSSKYPRFDAGQPMKAPTKEIYQNIVTAQKQAQPFVYPSKLIEIPMSPISDVHAFRTLRWNRKQYLQAIEMAVAWTIDNGGVFDFLAHPSCLVVEDPKLETIKMICHMVKKADKPATIVNLGTIAAHTKA